jgi:predicted glycoside hydrolase/deacetylase ChbG (UPF0249 family)
METNYIFTADDYGPIDFINRGVCYAVNKGLINSVQIIVNTDLPKLRQAIKNLHDSVPQEAKLDVGIHLTLTSGKPLLKQQNKQGHSAWGKMLKKGQFKDFKKFYFGYDQHLSMIEAEFDAQLNRLKDVLNAIPNCRLELTSVSHHHNIFSLSHSLFSRYVDVAEKHNPKLALRPPKALPVKTNETLFGFVVPFLNLTDNKADRMKMVRMNAALAKNEYAGPKDLVVKSANYIDIDYYSKLGSFLVTKLFEQKRIEAHRESIKEMLKRAEEYQPIKDREPDNKIIEFVFHVGDHKANRRGFKRMVRHYPGISHKYFENRQHELVVLEELFNEQGNELRSKLVSWKDCETINYKKQA